MPYCSAASAVQMEYVYTLDGQKQKGVPQKQIPGHMAHVYSDESHASRSMANTHVGHMSYVLGYKSRRAKRRRNPSAEEIRSTHVHV